MKQFATGGYINGNVGLIGFIDEGKVNCPCDPILKVTANSFEPNKASQKLIEVLQKQPITIGGKILNKK